jgi:hypothetical protein
LLWLKIGKTAVSAFMSIGRFALPNAHIAISTATSHAALIIPHGVMDT